ncbi:hypothetical protein MASR2M50_03920 [Thauera sp.]
MVKQPARISTSAGTYSGEAWMASFSRRMSVRFQEPAMSPRISMPAIIASPPAPVTVSAMRAPWRPSGRCFQ